MALPVLKLPDGHDWGDDLFGSRVCRGAMMGRMNNLPEDTSTPCKLRLVKLRMLDYGCYDQGGAYWGQGDPMYWATDQSGINVWTRAKSRREAKEKVKAKLPNAKFYR